MKKFALSLLLIILCVSVWAISYGIDSYSVRVTIGKDAVHSVSEDIAMNFYTAGHGFFRDIPYLFEGSPVSARITDVTCSDPFEHEFENGYYTMKIGDDKKTITGVHNYNISYKYDLGADIYEGYDEFYLDLLGNAWECNVADFSFEVYLPKEGLTLSDLNGYVTYGSYGSEKMLPVYVDEEDGFFVLFGEVKNLKAGQAVTMRLELPDGWYVDARQPWDVRDSFAGIAVYLCIVLLGIAIILWSKYGKDKKPIVTARFDAPEGFSPMVIGYLADGSVDDKDITSMIFNWADRGLLNIVEKRKNKFSFTKLAEIEEDAPKFERDLFNSFFRGVEVGKDLTLTQLEKNNFAEAMMKAKIAVASYFKKDKALYSKKARRLAVLTGFGVILPLFFFSAATFLTEYSVEAFGIALVCSLFITGFSILNQWLVFRKWYMRKSNVGPCIASAFPYIVSIVGAYYASSDILLTLVCCTTTFILSIFTIIIDKRSDYGQQILEEVLGYREFIDKVNMDELKMMVEKEPQLYYKVLSYAIVLGLENKWAKKFEGLAVAAPKWYVGYDMFDYMMICNMSARMRSAVAAHAVSSAAGKQVGGGGFHSTGFAGGGFGGGGGHAW